MTNVDYYKELGLLMHKICIMQDDYAFAGQHIFDLNQRSYFGTSNSGVLRTFAHGGIGCQCRDGIILLDLQSLFIAMTFPNQLFQSLLERSLKTNAVSQSD